MLNNENYFGQQSAIQKVDEEGSGQLQLSQFFEDSELGDLRKQLSFKTNKRDYVLEDLMAFDVENQHEEVKDEDEMIFAPQEDQHNDLKSSKIIDFMVKDEYYE